jgi:hypothetical protein
MISIRRYHVGAAPAEEPAVQSLMQHSPYRGHRVPPDIRGGSGNLDRWDEWSFCLTATKMVAI